MKQFDNVEEAMKRATTSAGLAELEREASLVVQEICLVAPRLHEAMMQTSRQRRYDLAHDVTFSYIPEEKVGKYIKSTIGIEEKPVEKPVENSAQSVIEQPTESAQSVKKTEVIEEAVGKRRSEALAEIAKQTEKISEQVSEIVDTVTEEIEKLTTNHQNFPEKCEKEVPKQSEKCDETEVKPVKPKAKKTIKKAEKK